MHTLISARLIAKGIKSPFQALRLVWSDGTDRCSEAAWAALTNGFERLTAAQIQQRLSAEGIEISLDAAADLQVEAVAQGPGSELPVLRLDDEHAVAAVDVCDGSSLHAPSPIEAAIVLDGGVV